MSKEAAQEFLKCSTNESRALKKLAEQSLDQVPEQAFFALLDPEANSIAILMKHLGGNLRSRWTAFLTSDGEKPDRDRDSEFVTGEEEGRDAILQLWEAGWRALFETLESLTPGDLQKTVTIRGVPHSVPQAILRTLRHCAYHVGQIVYLAKHLTGNRWQTLSIPRGGSREHNEKMRGRSGESSP